MKDHQEVIEKFDFILENSSEDDDVRRAEQKIKYNEEVLAEFEEHKLLVDGIRYASRKNLLKSIKTWDAQMTSKPLKRQFFIQKRWFYAAASIVIIFMFISVLTFFLKPEHEKLIANYYQPYSYNSDITRGDEVMESNGFFEAYQKGDYQKVIDLYNTGELSGDPVMRDFLYANACQVLSMYNLAMPVFEKISRTENPFAPAAKWYLAICYISQDDTDRATLLLSDLSKMKSSYSVKAEALLADLEK